MPVSLIKRSIENLLIKYLTCLFAFCCFLNLVPRNGFSKTFQSQPDSTEQIQTLTEVQNAKKRDETIEKAIRVIRSWDPLDPHSYETTTFKNNLEALGKQGYRAKKALPVLYEKLNELKQIAAYQALPSRLSSIFTKDSLPDELQRYMSPIGKTLAKICLSESMHNPKSTDAEWLLNSIGSHPKDYGFTSIAVLSEFWRSASSKERPLVSDITVSLFYSANVKVQDFTLFAVGPADGNLTPEVVQRLKAIFDRIIWKQYNTSHGPDGYSTFVLFRIFSAYGSKDSEVHLKLREFIKNRLNNNGGGLDWTVESALNCLAFVGNEYDEQFLEEMIGYAQTTDSSDQNVSYITDIQADLQVLRARMKLKSPDLTKVDFEMAMQTNSKDGSALSLSPSIIDPLFEIASDSSRPLDLRKDAIAHLKAFAPRPFVYERLIKLFEDLANKLPWDSNTALILQINQILEASENEWLNE